MPVVLDILTVACLLFGLFFMFIGALGLWRLPDLYNRMHAASKPITLGISGMLLAVIFQTIAVEEMPVIRIATKAVLVIIFQFVAAPVAAHMLSRAAHLDGAEQWDGTLSDELSTNGEHEHEPRP